MCGALLARTPVPEELPQEAENGAEESGEGTGLGCGPAGQVARIGGRLPGQLSPCFLQLFVQLLDPVAQLVLLRQEGPQFLAIELDLNNQSSVDRIASDLPSSWKQVDVLVNNAGHDVGGRRPFQDGDCVQWLDIIETNVNGLIRITYALLPDMLKRNRGHIVTPSITARGLLNISALAGTPVAHYG